MSALDDPRVRALAADHGVSAEVVLLAAIAHLVESAEDGDDAVQVAAIRAAARSSAAPRPAPGCAVCPATLDDRAILDAALEVHARGLCAAPIDLARSTVSGGESGGLVELALLGGAGVRRLRWHVLGAELVVEPWPDGVDRWPLGVSLARGEEGRKERVDGNRSR